MRVQRLLSSKAGQIEPTKVAWRPAAKSQSAPRRNAMPGPISWPASKKLSQLVFVFQVVSYSFLVGSLVVNCFFGETPLITAEHSAILDGWNSGRLSMQAFNASTNTGTLHNHGHRVATSAVTSKLRRSHSRLR